LSLTAPLGGISILLSLSNSPSLERDTSSLLKRYGYRRFLLSPNVIFSVPDWFDPSEKRVLLIRRKEFL